MLKGEKTVVFWVGLIILALASLVLFSLLWYVKVVGSEYYGSDFAWKFLTPPIVGAFVFILIGFYMIISGVRKEREAGLILNNRESPKDLAQCYLLQDPVF